MTRPAAHAELARLIEHTLRGADLTRVELKGACDEARSSGIGSICVNSSRVVQAIHWLDETDVKVTCAVGFPLGSAESDVKRYETEVAIDSGAHFIELTANLSLLKDGDDAGLLREFRDVVEAADERPVSIYLNAELLTADEMRRAAKLAVDAAAKGIAVVGGLTPASTIETLKLVRESVPEGFGIKADLDHTTLDEVITLLDLGVTRFGFQDGAKLLAGLSD